MPTLVQFGTERTRSLKEYIKMQRNRPNGTAYLPPLTFRFLPDTMPRYPRKHDKYFVDGGTHFPARFLISSIENY